jgi:hypothetical protein
MHTIAELKATKKICDLKMNDILRKGYDAFTQRDLLNLCTLAKLKDAAEGRMTEGDKS